MRIAWDALRRAERLARALADARREPELTAALGVAARCREELDAAAERGGAAAADELAWLRGTPRS